MMRTVLVILLVTACPAMGATYYADISVGSSGDGSIGSPWKTLADASTGLDALGDDGADDTLILAAGSYGQLTGGVWEKARTGPLTIQAANGATVRIGNGVSHKGVDLSPASLTNINLVLDGLLLQIDNPDPLPTDDGFFHWIVDGAEQSSVWLMYCQNLTIQNCEVVGARYRWLTHNCIYSFYNEGITITHCKIHGAGFYGIELYDCDDISIVGNLIYDIACGGCISQRDTCGGDILFDRDHMFDCYSPFVAKDVCNNYEHYGPYAENDTTTKTYHQSTVLGLHAYKADGSTYNDYECTWDSMVIRRNVIHDAVATGPAGKGGASQCLMSYGPTWGYYNALTVEANLFLEGGWVYFYTLGATAERPIVFRNNTWVGGRTTSTDTKIQGQVMQWYSSIGAFTLYSGNENWDNVSMANEIFRGRPSGYGYFPLDNIEDFTNKNCIFHAPYSMAVVPAWKDATTIFTVWIDPGTDKLRGSPNMFRYTEDYGPWTQMSWQDATDYTGPSGSKDYDYSENGVQIVFTDAYARDFTLTGNMPYLAGNVDLDTYGDSSVQSPYSLGQFDADGFILDNGQARDSSHHSVGAYEAGATIGYPVRPAICLPFNLEYHVDTSRQLVWRSGVGAESYNVYFGTSQALVAARNASVKVASETTSTTYDPTLSGETTYYWAVDSVGGTGLVAPGLVIEFETSDSEDEEPEEPPAGTRFLLILKGP